eukprot:scaffold47719_cov42-Prasinocladus_malaysianus.AAC.2
MAGGMAAVRGSYPERVHLPEGHGNDCHQREQSEGNAQEGDVVGEDDARRALRGEDCPADDV